MPDKTKVCNFCYKVDANKNVIVGNFCDKFENILSSSCTRAVQGPWWATHFAGREVRCVQ